MYNIKLCTEKYNTKQHIQQYKITIFNYLLIITEVFLLLLTVLIKN